MKGRRAQVRRRQTRKDERKRNESSPLREGGSGGCLGHCQEERKLGQKKISDNHSGGRENGHDCYWDRYVGIAERTGFHLSWRVRAFVRGWARIKGKDGGTREERKEGK